TIDVLAARTSDRRDLRQKAGPQAHQRLKVLHFLCDGAGTTPSSSPHLSLVVAPIAHARQSSQCVPAQGSGVRASNFLEASTLREGLKKSKRFKTFLSSSFG